MFSQGSARTPARTPSSRDLLRGAIFAGATLASIAAASATSTAAEAGPADGEDAPAATDGAAASTTADAEPTSAKAETKKPRMSRTQARPRRVFVDSPRRARFKFELAGKQKRTLVVKVKKLSDGKTRKRWRLKNVEPGETQKITWGGRTRKGGFTRQGKHVFRVYEPGVGLADTSNAEGKKRFRFFRHRFPIRAKHTFGDGFGAGRGHQGVDIFARCGKRMRAVRGGRVQVRSHHSRAGRYIVIDGRGTDRDYVYMHMKRRGRPQVGDRVRTGERIGYVGATGNASGCHLHFEVWRGPGWYEGGSPIRSIKPMTQRWDIWS